MAKTTDLTKWLGILEGGEERLKEFYKTLDGVKIRMTLSFGKYKT